MSSFVALYDACVLYPATLRDLLMWLALTDLYRAKWSRDIHAEWMASVLKARPDLTRGQPERVRRLMDANVRDCLVEGYEELVEAVRLPGPGDRHVLAAAIRAKAGVLVTYNLKHFPTEALAKYGIEAQHPDIFISHLVDLDADAVVEVVRRQRKNPARPSRRSLPGYVLHPA